MFVSRWTATKIEDLNWDERLEMHVMTTVMTVTIYFQVCTGYVPWEPAPSLIVPETEMCQEDRDAVRNVLLLVLESGEHSEQELEEF